MKSLLGLAVVAAVITALSRNNLVNVSNVCDVVGLHCGHSGQQNVAVYCRR